MKNLVLFFKKIFFKITRKTLRLILLLSLNSFKLRIHFLIYYFDENRENELFNLNKLILQKGKAIDIGCNKGLYSYALSKQKKISKIYSFEPNKIIIKDLYNYNCSKVKIYNLALSDKNKKNQLIIPFNKHQELDGWQHWKKIFSLTLNLKNLRK